MNRHEDYWACVMLVTMIGTISTAISGALLLGAWLCYA